MKSTNQTISEGGTIETASEDVLNKIARNDHGNQSIDDLNIETKTIDDIECEKTLDEGITDILSKFKNSLDEEIENYTKTRVLDRFNYNYAKFNRIIKNYSQDINECSRSIAIAMEDPEVENYVHEKIGSKIEKMQYLMNEILKIIM